MSMSEGRFWSELERSNDREKMAQIEHHNKIVAKLLVSQNPHDRLCGIVGAALPPLGEDFFLNHELGPSYRAGQIVEAYRLSPGETMMVGRYVVTAGRFCTTGHFAHECGGYLSIAPEAKDNPPRMHKVK
ncbi:MAG: hypothetical protein Athens071425_599 [Parcubacteria group bacterium Athens0714_25]|nr:MAG: hypothetical protein Athens071425_599 [Parcubacteria group bacterium Athens0714_25]